ncbi:MAG: GIY-YIG nuclease family protein [Candidatus Coatesbacteria bacterium]|nr:GIY-YIG nuclease family protein [Candidatus Coatesbacteria bacterium]
MKKEKTRYPHDVSNPMNIIDLDKPYYKDLLEENKKVVKELKEAADKVEETGYFVYILTNEANEIFFIDVTADLKQRITKLKRRDKLVRQSKVFEKLVYFEKVKDYKEASVKVNIFKKWTMTAKRKLIRKKNPELKDLSDEL